MNLKDQLTLQQMYDSQIRASKTAMQLKEEELQKAYKTIKTQNKRIKEGK